MCVCNESAPESAKTDAPRDECVFVHVRASLGMGVCMCVSSSLSSRQLLVSVCMYMYANAAEWLQLHKAFILLLIMKYFVLHNLVFSYNYTMQPDQ